MPKKDAAKNGEKTETNGALVFEKMGEDFTIPGRTRSGAYDDVLVQLQSKEVAGQVVAVFHAGKEAKAANTRRKSLLKAAEAKGLNVFAAVRRMGDDNVLLAQYKGKLKDAPKEE